MLLKIWFGYCFFYSNECPSFPSSVRHLTLGVLHSSSVTERTSRKKQPSAVASNLVVGGGKELLWRLSSVRLPGKADQVTAFFLPSNMGEASRPEDLRPADRFQDRSTDRSEKIGIVPVRPIFFKSILMLIF